jgi:hypothetical protein
MRTLVFLALLLAATPAHADDDRWSVGTSAWMLANAFPDPPDFYYLELSRTIGPRDALLLEPVTWRYSAPIGVPYGDSSEEYPGHVRSVGLGIGWRHRVYRGFHVSAHAFNFLQLYREDDRPRKSGYQLFLQTRLGWRWQVRSPGFWIEPSVAFNAWPIEVGRPASFRAMDERWPSYFLFEPWLNFGWSWRA